MRRIHKTYMTPTKPHFRLFIFLGVAAERVDVLLFNGLSKEKDGGGLSFALFYIKV